MRSKSYHVPDLDDDAEEEDSHEREAARVREEVVPLVLIKVRAKAWAWAWAWASDGMDQLGDNCTHGAAHIPEQGSWKGGSKTLYD